MQGEDESCDHNEFYHLVLKGSHYAKPTQSLLAKWLREEYNIDINIITKHKDLGKFYGGFIDTNNKINKSIGSNYKTYEEALEIGLQEALKLIK